ncbi:MAG: hypothetical protein JXR73_20310 [Candidatus Omnitrophica bacterium]|nr:hypothetical protein [Candidatus Omnitrophota bacterium]
MTLFRAVVCFIVFVACTPVWPEANLPAGSSPQPVEFLHFPSKAHAFVWRNWSVVEAERLAEVLETTPATVRRLAESMGLPEQDPIPQEDRSRFYITLLRRNWHLLPYDQLLTLLDMTAEELALSLREDDFLFIKLGSLKPKCERLIYTPAVEETGERCAAIRGIVEEEFGEALRRPEEKRFRFIEEFRRSERASSSAGSEAARRFSPCYIYSYFALFGDPLMNPELDLYPDGLLQRLADLGVDGVWMHSVLRQLAPSDLFPEFGEDHEIRLKNLRDLIERAKRFGIGVYLYVNEPRAMPALFFEGRESMRGVQEGDYFTMCTTAPEVRQWLSDSLAYVFENAPGLAGVFTITASENLTNCASHGRYGECPRCKERDPAEIIAEVNAAVERGVHRASPEAKVIAWDWGWRDDWAPAAIEKLPKAVYLMSVSEWSKPIERGGVKTAVGEYSISAVGPGPRAIRHWGAAQKAGLKTMAKMQINNTWELSAVPYLPVLDLVAEHCENLLKQNVDGLMLSWSLGGYPSPNLEVVDAFRRTPPPSREEALNAAARSCFGEEGIADAREAWRRFSEAFREYPYHGSVLYCAPQQYGPSNLLYPHPTGYAATMVGLPYDDVNGWRGPYPAEVLGGQYAKVAEGWKEGLASLRRAVKAAAPEKREGAQAQLRFAEAAQLHFQSTANQIRFCIIRNDLLDKTKKLSGEERSERIGKLKNLLEKEIEAARRLFVLARRDSRIGFEASNHYYYVPADLMEKVVNCRYILEHANEWYGKIDESD